jgi:Transglycosylase SLT domain
MGILTSYIGNQMGSNPSNASDFLSNYFGQRLANDNNTNPQANVTPQSTTINYNADGSADVTHKQTIQKDSAVPGTAPQPQVQAPQFVNLANSAGPNVNYQPPAPAVPVQGTQPLQNATQAAVPAPVAPQPYQPPQAPQGVFGRMIQAESGGQQFAPNGQILTSPKGAQGIAQIMPSTGANPGYGIAPATPQELATPQGNMLFGQRYFEGMFNYFGQDPEKAAAAYNAGPGTIEKAMRQADAQGGTWKDYIPDETKKYLAKVIPAGEETKKKFGPMLAMADTGTRTDVGMNPEEQIIHHMVLNSKDVNALGIGTYAGDHLIDPATKKAYADQHATILQQNKMEKDAEKRAQQLFMDGGVGMQRALKDDSEEGSYLKAYLFQRLGLHDLAKNEQQKLGAGDQWAQTMINGTPAWVKYNGQGAPVKGYTAEGELSGKDLINVMNMKGVTQHTGKMQDVTTGEIYYEQTTPFGPRLVDNQGKVYTGSSANLRAYGIGSDVATKNIIQLQTLRNRLLNEPAINQANFLAKFNAENGTNYTLPQVINSQAPMTAAPNQAPITGAQPAPAAPTAPAQGGAVAPQAAPQPAPAAGPAVPGQAPQAAPAPATTGQTQPGRGPSPTPGMPGTKPPPVPYAGESPAAFAARKKLYDEEMAKVAAEVGELKTKFPDYQAQVDKTLRTINDVITHPGFETNVGVKGVGGLLQLPGTEARNWQAKYKQLTGETFLSAFNSLRGGGAISDREGNAATEAQAALKDPGISEEEFRRNAKILEDTLKSGINRARLKIGQQPDAKYMLDVINEKTGKPYTPEEKKKAYEWAVAHPQDPRSRNILDRLGLVINE